MSILLSEVKLRVELKDINFDYCCIVFDWETDDCFLAFSGEQNDTTSFYLASKRLSKRLFKTIDAAYSVALSIGFDNATICNR